MMNEQIETEHKGYDKYVPGDVHVTVSVTSKPKICYPTITQNGQMICISLVFCSGKKTNCPIILLKRIVKIFSEPNEAQVLYMVFIREFLLQFDLMTRYEGYERITEGMNTKKAGKN